MIKLIKNEKAVYFLRYTACAAVCLTLAFLVMYFPKEAGNGITQAIGLCLRTVIPTLFPFIFISSLAVSSSLYIKLSKPFEKLTRLVFKLPGEAAGIILMALTGGFPVGTQMTCAVYEDGRLNKNEAQRLSLFAVNAGPAFVISTVGYGMLGSYKTGIIMYAALIVSSLSIGFLTRFLDDGSSSDPPRKIICRPPPISAAVSAAAEKSTAAMVNVCVWVILFNCLCSMLNVGASPIAKAAALFLEVTTGCQSAAGRLSVPLLTGIIGWSGLSVHCQVLSFNVKYGTDIKLFFASRVLNGGLSCLLCQWLIKLFPVNASVFSYAAENVHASFSGSLPVSAGLLMMCSLLLLGENFSLQKEKRY